jgi:hypothetical protein
MSMEYLMIAAGRCRTGWIAGRRSGAGHCGLSNAGGSATAKTRASDGSAIGSFAVGSAPRGIVFDGQHVWIANAASNTVTKLRASDGTLLGHIPVQSAPRGLAFDGAHVWVSNSGSGTVSKL